MQRLAELLLENIQTLCMECKNGREIRKGWSFPFISWLNDELLGKEIQNISLQTFPTWHTAFLICRSWNAFKLSFYSGLMIPEIKKSNVNITPEDGTFRSNTPSISKLLSSLFKSVSEVGQEVCLIIYRAFALGNTILNYTDCIPEPNSRPNSMVCYTRGSCFSSIPAGILFRF